MKEFQQDNDNKRKMYSKWVLLILLILILLVLKGISSIYAKQRNSREEMNSAEAKKAELQQRYDDLSGRVGDLKTNEGLEREIRSKFDVVKPGESVIVVVDKEVPAPAPVESNVIKRLWNDVVGVFKKK